MDQAKYKKLFLEEAREHLKSLSNGFVALEKEPEAMDAVDELFRHAHSMKGMASSMNYEPITLLSHAMEDVLDLVKRREVRVDPGLVDLLLNSLDRVEKMVGEIEAGDRVLSAAGDLASALRGVKKSSAPPPPAGAEEGLEEVVPEEEAPPPPEDLPGGLPPKVRAWLDGFTPDRLRTIREMIRSGLGAYHLVVDLAPDSMALGARAFIILRRLALQGMVAASYPGLDELRRGAASPSLEALVLFAGPPDALEGLVSGVPEVRRAAARRVRLEAADESGAAPAAGAGQPILSSLVEGLRKKQTVRVDTQTLDVLINTVGEMLISHERLLSLTEAAAPDLAEEVSRLGGLVQHFQETIMEVRMMPLEMVVGHFARMVRDLAHRAGKEVVYEAEGLDIELDRAILEDVGGVMVHILRNAVDHGLESPEERIGAGKAREGRIKFRAYREKDWVMIQLSDDGRGFDAEKLKAKALAMKAVATEALSDMDREEVLMLATLPGISTAESVTDVSGRGVGLDAVRNKVESLGGNINFWSAPGEGTTVTVRMPLSLAIIRVLTVAAGGQSFGLPLTRVHHAVDLPPGGMRRAGHQAYFRDGGGLVRLHRLADLLGVAPGEPPREDGQVVVVEKGRRRFGLLVDELIGIKDAVVKPIGQPLLLIPALAGATIMGDGRPMLILDVTRLI